MPARYELYLYIWKRLTLVVKVLIDTVVTFFVFGNECCYDSYTAIRTNSRTIDTLIAIIYRQIIGRILFIYNMPWTVIYTLRCTNFTGVERKREITESEILFDLYPCEQRAEVSATVTRRNGVNWDTRPCSRVDIYQIFWVIFCL